jgi:putative acetyltransferase
MIEGLLLREETINDYKRVFEINLAAFKQENESKLINALRDNISAFVPQLSIVAELNKKIVGHILFTKIHIKSNNGALFESLALAPMAVLPEFQNLGIGSRLVKHGIEKAKQLNFKSIIVLGHEKYYPKFGFKPAHIFNIKAPFDVPLNYFMALELEPDSLINVSGTVIYPKEFEMV